mgnify:CR=1 FL=1|tara:strand:- start:275 stop:445 length:171 start_codon:yes stop_codon:yes gene_type:complete
MNRPPSPHPNKLATIMEDYELKTFNKSTHRDCFEKVLNELKEIKEEIAEIKSKISK